MNKSLDPTTKMQITTEPTLLKTPSPSFGSLFYIFLALSFAF